MAVLNENIELFKCLIRVSHFTKNPEDDNKFHKAYAFAIQSVAELVPGNKAGPFPNLLLVLCELSVEQGRL